MQGMSCSPIIQDGKLVGVVTYVLVSDYSKYNWTMFDPEVKKVRHEEVFPYSMKKAFAFGAEMVSKPWE